MEKGIKKSKLFSIPNGNNKIKYIPLKKRNILLVNY